MNRRSFLQSLGMAAAVAFAAPAILRGSIERAMLEPRQKLYDDWDEITRRMQEQICRQMWRTNPYAQLFK